MDINQEIGDNLFDRYGVGQDFYEQLLHNMSEDQKKSTILMGLLFGSYLHFQNANKKSRGRPGGKFSIDQKRASMILSMRRNYKTSMPISKWIKLAKKIEDAMDEVGVNGLKSGHIQTERYFPNTLQLRSLENSVSRGMKLLDINFHLYQKNLAYYSMLTDA